jgi:hypothetical protein
MHNGRVIRRCALSALTAVVALLLAGCGGGDSSPATGGSSTSGLSQSTDGPDGTPTPTDAVVQGVKLSPEGSRLRLRQTARVSWKPDQRSTAVASIAVTRLQRVPISTFADWRLPPETLKATPYIVHATVRNLGRTNLAGAPVPLYLLDQRNTLLQSSSFQAQFKACPSTPLPAKFTRGKSVSVCLVYFVPDHGKLVAISFRPTQDFDAITWDGPVGSPKHAKK